MDEMILTEHNWRRETSRGEHKGGETKKSSFRDVQKKRINKTKPSLQLLSILVPHLLILIQDKIT